LRVIELVNYPKYEIMRTLIILITSLFIAINAYTQILVQDSLALVNFYNATNGPNWQCNSHWLTDPVSEWFGIYTQNNRVEMILLTGNELEGELPASIGDLTALERLNINNNQLYGDIPDEIANLTKLKIISIAANLYTGEFPTVICDLDSLIHLFASDNSFEGEIPAEVFNMPMLEWLDLGYNSFSGCLPQENNLDSLEILYISHNLLSGEIPTGICNCTNLTGINISNNCFTGMLPPEIGNLTKLGQLWISSNMFSGEIPTEINNLTELYSIHFNDNNFSGTMPSLAELDKLEWLYLDFNNFTGVPDFTENDSLKVLWISENMLTFEDIEPIINNNFVQFRYAPQDSIGEEQTIMIEQGVPISICAEVGGTGNLYQWFKFDEPIPGANDSIYTILAPEPWNIGIYKCHVNNSFVTDLTIYSRPVRLISDDQEINALLAFYLSVNGVEWDTAGNWFSSAPFCDWYGIDTLDGHITAIKLPQNNLKGELPQEMGDLDSLQVMDFFINDINGGIPQSITNLKNLKYIDLDYNNLDENPLPVFAQMPGLEVLRLRSNYCGGEIPAEIGNMVDLTELNIYGCSFDDPIPPSLFTLAKLEVLSMGGNNFTGNFPDGLTSLISLKHFDIGGGNFEGDIFSLVTQLASLEYLNLSGNNFDGPIPPQISNLSNLKTFYASSLNSAGAIPDEIGSLSKLEKLGLAGNDFTGSIPMSFQNLENLVSLALYNNQLTGTFPVSICNLPELKYLNLNENEFSGALPPEIGNLKQLQSLSIEHNNLTDIPSEIGLLDSLKGLHLQYNNIASVPASFSNLHALRMLRLSNNQLTSFIFNIDSLNALYEINIKNNFLTFESIEPYVNQVENFYYTSQELLGEDVYVIIRVGDPFDISVDIGGEYNEYQWYLDWEPILGANNSNYSVSSATYWDYGTYCCVITNSVATELTLVSYNFFVGETYDYRDQSQQGEMDITVFPNPANDILYISNPNGLKLEGIRFYNQKGNEELHMKSVSNTLNISVLKPGFYTIEIISESRIIRIKFLKN